MTPLDPTRNAAHLFKSSREKFLWRGAAWILDFGILKISNLQVKISLEKFENIRYQRGLKLEAPLVVGILTLVVGGGVTTLTPTLTLVV